ncbi:hypothetical protein [Entomospira culicis]|uniref:Uncharacterized protein n=1 Tax=Entomospira culicis TaxID=2719989 RepID=A0A968GH21_9SPIO|nr:hypothetical protein [Entomospira culicis]NIZ20001.1 hypothetical protein [Entomospira culicis]NIZ70197.1 hypothetical protein [Entomospira culicis]WDI38092.1 hypothetical protein PVA46_08245 [Entomospira culicis]WDI39714.1 hypothetical protein PVA47_08245 [Entomospira culicis]
MKKLMGLFMAVLVGVSFNTFAITPYEEALLNNDITKFEQQVNFLEVQVKYQDLLKLYLFETKELRKETLEYLIQKGADLRKIIMNYSPDGKTQYGENDYGIESLSNLALTKIKDEEIFNFLLLKSNSYQTTAMMWQIFSSLILDSLGENRIFDDATKKYVKTSYNMPIKEIRDLWLTSLKNGMKGDDLVERLHPGRSFNLTEKSVYIRHILAVSDDVKHTKEYIKAYGTKTEELVALLTLAIQSEAEQVVATLLAYDKSLATEELLKKAKTTNNLKIVNSLEKALS